MFVCETLFPTEEKMAQGAISYFTFIYSGNYSPLDCLDQKITKTLRFFVVVFFCCRFMSKRVTSGGAHLRGLALGQSSSKETWQRWRAVGDTVSDLTAPGITLQTFRIDGNVL